MKLRRKEFHCLKCNRIRIFTELEFVFPHKPPLVNTNDLETGAINPYFICSHCDYAERLEYLEYPLRKPPPSFLKKKWKAFLSKIKGNL